MKRSVYGILELLVLAVSVILLLAHEFGQTEFFVPYSGYALILSGCVLPLITILLIVTRSIRPFALLLAFVCMIIVCTSEVALIFSSEIGGHNELQPSLYGQFLGSDYNTTLVIANCLILAIIASLSICLTHTSSSHSDIDARSIILGSAMFTLLLAAISVTYVSMLHDASGWLNPAPIPCGIIAPVYLFAQSLTLHRSIVRTITLAASALTCVSTVCTILFGDSVYNLSSSSHIDTPDELPVSFYLPLIIAACTVCLVAAFALSLSTRNRLTRPSHEELFPCLGLTLGVGILLVTRVFTSSAYSWEISICALCLLGIALPMSLALFVAFDTKRTLPRQTRRSLIIFYTIQPLVAIISIALSDPLTGTTSETIVSSLQHTGQYPNAFLALLMGTLCTVSAIALSTKLNERNGATNFAANLSTR